MKTAGASAITASLTMKAATPNAALDGNGSIDQPQAEKENGQWEGIWAGLPTMFNKDWSLDLGAMGANIQRMLKAEVQGIYLLGSTGEFYALNFDEFRQLADFLVKTAGGHGIPLAVNCGAQVTRETIRRLEFIKHAGLSAGQFVLPYWMELTDRELTQFFRDLHAAAPDLPLIHYNIPRAKRFLVGSDYAKAREVTPNLVAVKFTFAGSHFGDLQDAVQLNPGLKFLIAENLLVSGMQVGARGSCSSIVYTNPDTVLKMYRLAKEHKWDEALSMQSRMNTLFTGLDAELDKLGEGGIDPVVDKGLGLAAGGIVGHPRTRAPYIGWSEESVLAVRAWLKEGFPDFLAKE
jgi:4-hydroxy-tetrahydrodipicolinate synthase